MKKILIVDDQSFNIEAMMVILKYSVGIEDSQILVPAFNGKEALEKIMDDV